jgi:pSer/pThr/pTyr-binding forkhead associated (FHA) protein
MPKLHFTTPDGATHEFEISADRARIGRADDNDFVLPDASVSSRHGEIIRKGDSIEIVDLGSTNGSFKDGQRVERMDIEPGGSFKLGSVDGIFISDAPSGDAEAEGGEESQEAGAEASGGDATWNVTGGHAAAITGLGATDCPKNLRRGFGPKAKAKGGAGGIFTLLGVLSLIVCGVAAYMAWKLGS